MQQEAQQPPVTTQVMVDAPPAVVSVPAGSEAAPRTATTTEEALTWDEKVQLALRFLPNLVCSVLCAAIDVSIKDDDDACVMDIVSTV
jgi:hypothetical protein